MNQERILIVEDDEAVRQVLTLILTEAGYRTHTVEDGPQAIEAARQGGFDLFLIDLQLPGLDGMAVLKEIRGIQPQAPCLVLTGHGSIEASVQAMKAGAYDFITKPFEVNAVLALLRSALDDAPAKQPGAPPEKPPASRAHRENLVYRSESMVRVCELMEKVADRDSTILIQGESGTGKEVIARCLHEQSRRRHKPFLPINCGAIPESLLESELFGHEKGAFTGATAARLGRFELAHGGTLFLDEVSELPLPMQVKLLRVLQDRSFERVGGVRSIRVDVRIIAATNQDLEQAVAEKRFRKDLFYRLHVIPIELSPLRERQEDIPLLIRHFIRKFNQTRGQRIEGVTEEALRLMLKYPWPGNVRELENLIERVTALKQDGHITAEELPDKLCRPAQRPWTTRFELPEEGIDFSSVISEFEDQLLQQALAKAHGVKNRAAQMLKLNRTTLVEKLKKRGIFTS